MIKKTFLLFRLGCVCGFSALELTVAIGISAGAVLTLGKVVSQQFETLRASRQLLEMQNFENEIKQALTVTSQSNVCGEYFNGITVDTQLARTVTGAAIEIKGLQRLDRYPDIKSGTRIEDRNLEIEGVKFSSAVDPGSTMGHVSQDQKVLIGSLSITYRHKENSNGVLARRPVTQIALTVNDRGDIKSCHPVQISNGAGLCDNDAGGNSCVAYYDSDLNASNCIDKNLRLISDISVLPVREIANRGANNANVLLPNMNCNREYTTLCPAGYLSQVRFDDRSNCIALAPLIAVGPGAGEL